MVHFPAYKPTFATEKLDQVTKTLDAANKAGENPEAVALFGKLAEQDGKAAQKQKTSESLEQRKEAAWAKHLESGKEISQEKYEKIAPERVKEADHKEILRQLKIAI